MSDDDDSDLRRRLEHLGGRAPDVDAALTTVTARARQARRQRIVARVGGAAAVVALVVGAAAAFARHGRHDGIGVADTTTFTLPGSTSPTTSSSSTTSTTSTVPTPTTATSTTDTGPTSSDDASTATNPVPGGAGTTQPTGAPPGTSRPTTPAPAQEQTIPSGGGSIRVRLADGSLSLVGAPRPAAGYDVDVEDAWGDRVRVRFERSDRSYRITATIVGGHISSDVEQGGGSGGSGRGSSGPGSTGPTSTTATTGH
jgi:hypothetical protein